MKPQVVRSYYFSEKYLSLHRFISYFYQLRSIQNANARSVLFVGVGDGMVVDILKKYGTYDVTSVDIDAELQPDVVADVRKLPFPDNSFDLVCVFEVLEHMPFEDSQTALSEIARVAKIGAVVSVPHRRSGFEFVLRFPLIRSLFKRDLIDLRVLVPIRFHGIAVSGQHYWEIDGRGMPLRTFRAALKRHFDIVREETPVLDSYRRFFHLCKVNDASK